MPSTLDVKQTHLLMLCYTVQTNRCCSTHKVTSAHYLTLSTAKSYGSIRIYATHMTLTHSSLPTGYSTRDSCPRRREATTYGRLWQALATNGPIAKVYWTFALALRETPLPSGSHCLEDQSAIP